MLSVRKIVAFCASIRLIACLDIVPTIREAAMLDAHAALETPGVRYNYFGPTEKEKKLIRNYLETGSLKSKREILQTGMLDPVAHRTILDPLTHEVVVDPLVNKVSVGNTVVGKSPVTGELLIANKSSARPYVFA